MIFLSSGLIAARELGLQYPDLREQIFVVSSIYNASVKVMAEPPPNLQLIHLQQWASIPYMIKMKKLPYKQV